MNENLKRLITLILVSALIMIGCASTASKQGARSINTYYVRANGNDSNNGLTENTAFMTIERAIQAASASRTKQITVIGTLRGNTIIRDSGTAEILITGKPDAHENEKAILIPTNPLLFEILGNSKIRFENITLQGTSGVNNAISQGIAVNGSEVVVTLGRNVLITQFFSNDGAGIFLQVGNIHMTDNATIARNVARNSGGGIYINRGSLVMDSNSSIRDNEARSTASIDRGGGGIFIWAGNVNISGNSLITGNRAAVLGGGIYCAGGLIINGVSILDMEGGGQWGEVHTFKTGNIHSNSSHDVYENYN